MYGSILQADAGRRRPSTSAPNRATARPLPSDDTTPPVTKEWIYGLMRAIFHRSFSRSDVGRFLDGGAAGGRPDRVSRSRATYRRPRSGRHFDDARMRMPSPIARSCSTGVSLSRGDAGSTAGFRGEVSRQSARDRPMCARTGRNAGVGGSGAKTRSGRRKVEGGNSVGVFGPLDDTRTAGTVGRSPSSRQAVFISRDWHPSSISTTRRVEDRCPVRLDGSSPCRFTTARHGYGGHYLRDAVGPADHGRRA